MGSLLRPIAGGFAMALALTACGAASAELRRAEESYEQARYENALSWLADLEPNAPSLDHDERARYFYVRGMTEFRLGHRSEALYYLAVAREIAGEDGVGLRPEQQELLARTVGELTPNEPMTHQPPAPAEE
ncbi:MAG: hypothetical protein U0234_17630 [Sandaracinus sp.]